MKQKKSKPIRPAKSLSDLRKVLKAYHDFLVAFETVFAGDDHMTCASLAAGETFDLEAAIENPGQFDGDNWANRAILLSSYGSLKRLLGESSII